MGPDNIAGLESIGERPLDRGRLPRVSWVRPVGVPAGRDLLAQPHPHLAPGDDPRKLADQLHAYFGPTRRRPGARLGGIAAQRREADRQQARENGERTRQQARENGERTERPPRSPALGSALSPGG